MRPRARAVGKAAAQQLTSLAVIGIGLMLGAVWGVPRVVGKDSMGLVVVAGGPLLAALVYAIWRRRSGTLSSAGPRPRMVLLALLLGPLLGTLGWGAYGLIGTTATPAEQMEMLGGFALLGALAGGIVALALAVLAWFR